ncbi:HIG1 domain family member 1C-like [Adelges cooleyi]|uniref:HIG1 domain family member 1C-like n=1 Tax=Adelges cooleyi TaxID=133065 RepID=UPI0021801193|nr:HIG1 domain family member 1C-like [Adelges cooleyi]
MEEEDSFANRFSKKTNQMPMFPIGMAAFGCIAAYGLYKFKNRKGPISLYLIQLRLAAQGSAVGIIGLGLFYNIYKDLVEPKFKP